MQAFWMPVGLVTAIAPKEAISHGATSNVAKLRLASTNFPLLIDGVMSSAATEAAAAGVFGCMRERRADGGVGSSGGKWDEVARFLLRDGFESSSPDELGLEDDS